MYFQKEYFEPELLDSMCLNTGNYYEDDFGKLKDKTYRFMETKDFKKLLMDRPLDGI